jgi:hypothetical protein
MKIDFSKDRVLPSTPNKFSELNFDNKIHLFNSRISVEEQIHNATFNQYNPEYVYLPGTRLLSMEGYECDCCGTIIERHLLSYEFPCLCYECSKIFNSRDLGSKSDLEIYLDV